MKNLSTAAAVAFSLLALTACTPKISKTNLESLVTTTFAKQNFKLKTVTCPGEREIKAGDKFECTGELDEGGKVTIKMDQKDGKGMFEMDVVGAVVRDTELTTFVAKTHPGAVVTCPKKMAVLLKGEKLDCTLVAGADKGKLAVVSEGEKLQLTVTMEGKPAEAPAETAEDKPAEAEAPKELSSERARGRRPHRRGLAMPHAFRRERGGGSSSLGFAFVLLAVGIFMPMNGSAEGFVVAPDLAAALGVAVATGLAAAGFAPGSGGG